MAPCKLPLLQARVSPSYSQLKLFPQQNLHAESAAAVCCDSQTCLQCGSLQGAPAARGASPRNSQLAAQPGCCRGAAASFLPGSTAGGGTDCCNAVRQRARRPDTADSATALHVTSLYRLHTFWHFSVNRQYLQCVFCHRKSFVGLSHLTRKISSISSSSPMRWIICGGLEGWREPELSVSWQRPQNSLLELLNNTTRNLSPARTASEALLLYLLL